MRLPCCVRPVAGGFRGRRLRDVHRDDNIIGDCAVAHTETSDTTTRRDFLYIATGAVGAVGAAAMAWPFISQLQPDASVLALSTTEVDLSPIAEGQIVTVQWRGKPIFISHRTPAEIKAAVDTPLSDLKDPQPDSARVKAGKDQWLVVIGICTHLGCVPLGQQGAFGGYFCPCHGSVYDTAGRIRSGPAPENLHIPEYAFVSDTRLKIG